MIRTLAIWLLAAVLLGLAVASLLPLIESNAWWVRLLDFPRMQFAALLIVLGALWLALGGARGALGLGLVVLVLAALGYHAYRLWPYQPLAATMAPGAATCPLKDRLRVVVANVRKTSRDAGKVLAMVDAQNPDLLLVLETNAWWDEALSPLDAAYPHHEQHIPEDAAFFGMHVYSRHPFDAAEMLFPFGADAPLFSARIAHPAGVVRFLGVHPRPPQVLDQSSTIRDATILRAALLAAEGDAPAIIAGDYNATPWERTARRAMRLGRLIDPRAGRGPAPTFDAQSWWMRWPLDQVLWQAGPSLIGYEVLPEIGSDHFPFRTDLCIGGNAGPQHPAAPAEGDMAEAERTFAAAAALPAAAASNWALPHAPTGCGDPRRALRSRTPVRKRESR